MKRSNVYVISIIVIFTIATIIFLIFQANELQKYATVSGVDITYQKNIENYLHILERLISNALGMLSKQ